MKKAMKQIGWEAAMIVMAIVLVAAEYLIADTFGMTINGMSYFEYAKWCVSAHPFVMMIESALIGLMIGNFSIS